MVRYQWREQTLVLNKLQPQASKNEVCGWQGEYLKVRLTSPPVDGQANKQLLVYMAELFSVSRSYVALLSGDKSRFKQIAIQNPRQLPAFLNET